MLTVTSLGSAMIVAPISMAKIEGAQSAQKTVSLFTEGLLPYAPKDEDSTDIKIVTTEGLYCLDSDQSAYDLREKLWSKGDSFRRKFSTCIKEAQKDFPRILPNAYELETFDTVRTQTSDLFRQLAGFLKNEAATNSDFREKVVADLGNMGQPERPDKIAFLIEEFVWSWTVYKGSNKKVSKTSLRKHDQGQTIICYPGALLPSQIEAYRLMSFITGALPLGRSIYLDTSLNRDEDVAHTIEKLNLSSPARRNLSTAPRRLGPRPSIN